MGVKCLDSIIIYRVIETKKCSTYTGTVQTCCNTRPDGGHNKIDANQTTLSSNLNNLNREKVNFELKWKIIDHAKPINPVTGICALCTREMFYIASNMKGPASLVKYFKKQTLKKRVLMFNNTQTKTDEYVDCISSSVILC